HGAEGADDHAAAAGGEDDLAPHPQPRVEGAVERSAAELDAGHDPAAADLGDPGEAGDLGEALAEAAAEGAGALEGVLLLEEGERRPGDGAGERVGGEGVPVVEGAVLGIRGGEEVEELVADQGCGEREVAAAQALA